MQECRDIFGKIEISAGMWNTYKHTHFKKKKKNTHKFQRFSPIQMVYHPK